jgi:hypothetical protein
MPDPIKRSLSLADLQAQSGPAQVVRKNPQVYISTPSWDRGLHPAYHLSIINQIVSGSRMLVSLYGMGDFLLRARNRQAHQFLHHPDKPDFFFCIGSDIDWQPDYFWRIVNRNLPIVAGLYAIKENTQKEGEHPRWCNNTFDVNPPVVDGLLEIEAGGTDFLCIRRDVMEAIAASDIVGKYENDFPGEDKTTPSIHFFPFLVAAKKGSTINPDPDWRKNRLYSEDYAFCLMARQLGFKVMLDVTGHCGHWDGRTRYPIHAPPGRKPTPAESANCTTHPEHGGAQ